MVNIAMFATYIMAWRINSLGCQKFTSSIPGCREKQRKSIIIRNDGADPWITRRASPRRHLVSPTPLQTEFALSCTA